MPSPATQRAVKQAVMGLRLMVAFCAFILDIIQLRTAEVGAGTYPPATASMLVAAALQAAQASVYFAVGGAGVMYQARALAGTNALFVVWQTVSVAVTTADRYTGRYCGPTSTNRADCRGVLKGVMALGYTLVGVNLVQIATTASAVRSSGTWRSEMRDLPPRGAGGGDAGKEQA